MKRVLIFIIFTISTSLCTAQQNNSGIDNSFIDTSKYSVLSYKKIKPWHLDSSSIDTPLSQKEIKEVEKLFFKAVSKYNFETSRNIDSIFKDKNENKVVKRERLVDLKNNFYFKQLFPVINKNGEKIVWINCFSADLNNLENTPKYILVDIADGENMYFNLYINLTTNKFYGMRINAGG